MTTRTLDFLATVLADPRPDDVIAREHGVAARTVRHWRYQARKRMGLGRVVIPSGPTLAHLDTLLAEGPNRAEIARAAGLSPRAVHGLCRRRPPTVWRRTADALLAVEPFPPDDPTYVDPIAVERVIYAAADVSTLTPAERRAAIRLATRCGWGNNEIEARLRVSGTVIANARREAS
jgi:transposase-like protein